MGTAKMIFITGGVRSGKSAYAEALAESLSVEHEWNLHYIACGVASDPEMQKRIHRHQTKRSEAIAVWKTWEKPYQLNKIADQFTDKDVLVLDCMTTLLNNYLFLCRMTDKHQVISNILADVDSLSKTCRQIIIVSNEVFQGMPHEDTLTTTYQALLGTIHQHIVNRADYAYLIEHGIPICKKGVMM